jgi:uncharacterized damage-inducible protein DinB
MPALSQELQKKIRSWAWIQSLAFDVLKMVSDDQLGLTVGANMGTLGEQLLHMTRARFQYAEAIEAGRVAGVREPIEPAASRSTARLTALWEKANRRVVAAVEQANQGDQTTIDWTYWGIDQMNIHDHLNVLMDHETLHNGQLIVYLRSNNLAFPESWKFWGL